MDYYGSIAKGYDNLHKEEQMKKVKIIAKHIKPKSTERSEGRLRAPAIKAPLLDIGAGTGISTEFFKVDSIALEPSKEMLRQYKGKKAVGKAEALPFKDNTFNTIISVTALHHTNIEKAIKEIKRVSKKGCVYAFTILKKAGNAEKIRRLLKENFKLKEIEEEKDWVLVSE